MEASVHLLKQAAVRIALQLGDRKETHAHSREWTVLKDTSSMSTLIERQSTSWIMKAGYVAKRAIVPMESV